MRDKDIRKQTNIKAFTILPNEVQEHANILTSLTNNILTVISLQEDNVFFSSMVTSTSEELHYSPMSFTSDCGFNYVT